MNSATAENPGRRVTTLELFFDLVFVFTLTQLTVLLAGDLTFATAGRVALIFVVLFWMYGAYAYLTNQVPPDRLSRRLLLMLGMGAFLVCALAIPRVFDDTGVVFGLGFLAVVLVHTALYTRSHGRDSVWYGVPNALAALSVTAAGFFDGLAADGLWLLALLLQFVTPFFAEHGPGRADGQRSAAVMRVQLGSLDPAHFVERHGLLLIVAFGESVIAIGTGVGQLPLTPGLFGGAFLSLALAVALWWTYFVRDEEGAEAVFDATPAPDRWRLAMNAYYYAFLPMLLGIAYLATGVKKTLGHLTEHVHTGPALALAGGVALFLVGDVAFRAVLRLNPVRFRAAAAPVALATTLLGVRVSAVAELLALVGVLVVMLTVEARSCGSVKEVQSFARS
ncbi:MULTISPECIES: low temperature requirement protein A [unclassified Streptomyces]|uniref:low temperature requirement protein A n=1 Tax=unclassified Streptomyces TaxID=2593676 RepID=UPI002258CA3D|nr:MULTISPECIES: low temperature requirement protein A [unclassified Streptomyces]MCX5052791.1 low temperature requirement protein A [Streptomyces sp. NBC_00474]MCX5062613.1 low temperature requirement protein A [Streptomyces sp. NBC_00452]MCX5250243.1 low temperature requirement protein A [Streptomyces sp. NBC_00201]MCX5291779.1 low temperature requirement protein A [Streptomyces sp. NBC_00183]